MCSTEHGHQGCLQPEEEHLLVGTEIAVSHPVLVGRTLADVEVLQIISCNMAWNRSRNPTGVAQRTNVSVSAQPICL